MIIGKTEFISDLYKDKPFYILEEYDKKYRFKIHSGRVGGEINNKHLIITNFKIETENETDPETEIQFENRNETKPEIKNEKKSEIKNERESEIKNEKEPQV